MHWSLLFPQRQPSHITPSLLLPLLWQRSSFSSHDFIWLEAKCSSSVGVLRFRQDTWKRDLKGLSGFALLPLHTEQSKTLPLAASPQTQTGRISSAYSLSSHDTNHLLPGNILALAQHCTSLSHRDIRDKVSRDITFGFVGNSHAFLISNAWAYVQTSFGRMCQAWWQWHTIPTKLSTSPRYQTAQNTQHLMLLTWQTSPWDALDPGQLIISNQRPANHLQPRPKSGNPPPLPARGMLLFLLA